MLGRVLIMLAVVAFTWVGNIAGFTYSTSLISRASNTTWLGFLLSVAIVLVDVTITYFWLQSAGKLIDQSTKKKE